MKTIDNAKPVIKKKRGTDAAKIKVTRSMTTIIQGSPEFGSAPELQSATAEWNKEADRVEANAKLVAELQDKLAAAQADQQAIRRDWSAATQKLIAHVAVFAKGSADQLRGLGFDVRSRTPSSPQEAPAGLVAYPGDESGEVVVRWQRGGARHGFIVQHTTDPANPAAFSPNIPVTRTKYTLVGALPSSIVHLRVAAVDPTSDMGHSPWSDWVVFSVR